MSAVLLDTHAVFRKLKEVGFSEEQAEVITDLQKSTIQNTLEQARHDYELDKIATKRDLKELEMKLELKISDTKAELVRWVVAVGLLQVTIITALILKLVH